MGVEGSAADAAGVTPRKHLTTPMAACQARRGRGPEEEPPEWPLRGLVPRAAFRAARTAAPGPDNPTPRLAPSRLPVYHPRRLLCVGGGYGRQPTSLVCRAHPTGDVVGDGPVEDGGTMGATPVSPQRFPAAADS